LFDKYIPLQGLSLQIDASGNPYIQVPSITYFQDVMEPNSLNRFINLTERVISISGTSISIDPDYQKFYTGDNIRLVKFDKGKYSLVAEESFTITGSSPNFTLNTLPVNMVIDESNDVYILNDTYRSVTNATNFGGSLKLAIDGYDFSTGQLVGIIVSDGSTGYSWGSSYKVTAVDGSISSYFAAICKQRVTFYQTQLNAKSGTLLKNIREAGLVVAAKFGYGLEVGF